MVVSGDDVISSVLFGPKTQNTINYFKEKLDNFNNTLNSIGTSASTWLQEKASNIYNNFYSDAAVARSREILMNSSVQFRDDVIHKVNVDSYRPNLKTQRYMLACPEVWDLYLKDMTSNFGGTYLDLEPCIRDVTMRDEYIDVMKDEVQFDKDGNGFYYSYVTSDEIDRPELTDEEIEVIRHNWRVAKHLIALDRDPTELD